MVYLIYCHVYEGHERMMQLSKPEGLAGSVNQFISVAAHLNRKVGITKLGLASNNAFTSAL